jgi:hypothetical protein
MISEKYVPIHAKFKYFWHFWYQESHVLLILFGQFVLKNGSPPTPPPSVLRNSTLKFLVLSWYKNKHLLKNKDFVISLLLSFFLQVLHQISWLYTHPLFLIHPPFFGLCYRIWGPATTGKLFTEFVFKFFPLSFPFTGRCRGSLQ